MQMRSMLSIGFEITCVHPPLVDTKHLKDYVSISYRRRGRVQLQWLTKIFWNRHFQLTVNSNELLKSRDLPSLCNSLIKKTFVIQTQVQQHGNSRASVTTRSRPVPANRIANVSVAPSNSSGEQSHRPISSQGSKHWRQRQEQSGRDVTPSGLWPRFYGSLRDVAPKWRQSWCAHDRGSDTAELRCTKRGRGDCKSYFGRR